MAAERRSANSRGGGAEKSRPRRLEGGEGEPGNIPGKKPFRWVGSSNRSGRVTQKTFVFVCVKFAENVRVYAFSFASNSRKTFVSKTSKIVRHLFVEWLWVVRVPVVEWLWAGRCPFVRWLWSGRCPFVRWSWSGLGIYLVPPWSGSVSLLVPQWSGGIPFLVPQWSVSISYLVPPFPRFPRVFLRRSGPQADRDSSSSRRAGWCRGTPHVT